MWKYVKRFGLSRAHKVPPVLYKVCRKTKFFVTLSWIWNKVNVKKMKGMLHIYNDCTIDWHQVCANMWRGLGLVAYTKYHPYSGRTDAQTWILCPPFGAFAPRGTTSSCRRDVPCPQFKIEHVGALEWSRNRLNGCQGQNKIGSAYPHQVGIAIHTW